MSNFFYCLFLVDYFIVSYVLFGKILLCEPILIKNTKISKNREKFCVIMTNSVIVNNFNNFLDIDLDDKILGCVGKVFFEYIIYNKWGITGKSTLYM